MARGVLTVQNVALTGLAPSYAAGDAVNNHQFTNDGNTFLQVKNAGGGAACVVTVHASDYKVGGVSLADITVSVPITTGDRMIGPFDTTAFNQSGGVVHVDLDQATSVTLAAIRVP